VLGRYQQQGDADHALREASADIGHREAAQHRLAEQRPVGSSRVRLRPAADAPISDHSPHATQM
jgi:hypothetical protein